MVNAKLKFDETLSTRGSVDKICFNKTDKIVSLENKKGEIYRFDYKSFTVENNCYIINIKH